MLKRIWDDWKGPLLLLLICLVLAGGKMLMRDTGKSCSIVSLWGVGATSTDAYTQVMGTQDFYRWDWDTNTWVSETVPDGVTIFSSVVGVNHDGQSVMFTPDSDGIGIWVGNAYTRPCK